MTLVDVWTINTAIAPASTLRFLSRAEYERANAVRNGDRRQEMVATRGALRMLLSHYLKVPPNSLAFRTGPHGKPELLDTPPRLRFNVSHTRALSLIAVAWDCEVGVDVEWIDPRRQADVIARRCFARRDTVALTALPEAERLAGFFRLWSAKEAAVKAVGLGLHMPLKQIELPAHEGLVRIPTDARAWQLRRPLVRNGYVAAVVTDSTRLELRNRQFAWSTRLAA